MEASGSIFTNKYSEGYPNKRYYEGQQVTDLIETLAVDRAKKIFKADHANVQPYSGSVANLAAYNALIRPGDTLMGLALTEGGHLTHGWKVSCTSRFYRSVQYTVDPSTGRLDYDRIAELARKHRPRIIISGATAYPRAIDFEAFGRIAREVGAYHVSDIAHISGLVVAGCHQSPVPYADIVSTTTHKTLRGPRGGLLLCRREHADKVDRAVFPGLQGGPHMHTITGIAVALAEADTREFLAYAHQIVANAKALAEGLQEHGFDLVSGGTDNHLILIDLRSKGIGGKKLARALDRAGIVTNYNTIPGDPAPPLQSQRPAHRHAGGDHAGDARAGDGHHRAPDESGGGKAVQRLRAGQGGQGGAAALFPVPRIGSLHHSQQAETPLPGGRVERGGPVRRLRSVSMAGDLLPGQSEDHRTTDASRRSPG